MQKDAVFTARLQLTPGRMPWVSKRLKTQTPPPRPPIYDAFAPHYERALEPLERLILKRLRAATLRALAGNNGDGSSDSGEGSGNGGDGSSSSDGDGDNAGDGGGRLLEIGAGTGLNFPHYPPGAHGAATEPSRAMLRLAKARPRPEGVHLVQNRAEALPFADDAFDAAFATLVFCSVASPPLAFAELRRVVRAGGRVVLLEHVRPAGLLGLVFDAISFFTVRLCEDHFNRRTAEEARRAGLRIVRIEPHALGIIQLIVCEV
jgi:SAM-dependent methyltransferase